MRDVLWCEDHVLEVDGVRFVARGATNSFKSTSDRFCLVKRPDVAAAYLELLADLRPATIVEPGVYRAEAVPSWRWPAIPRCWWRSSSAGSGCPPLDALIAKRGLSERVHVHHGVDQADAATLGRRGHRQFDAADFDISAFYSERGHALLSSRL